MDELQQITEIINESVKNSSYVTAIISSCVFIIYTIIIRLIDFFKNKDRNKPILEMSKALKEMGDNIIKLNSILTKTLEDAENKEVKQCEHAINLSFKAFAFKLSQSCATIIAYNNIEENRELIEQNIRKLVNNEYYKLYSILSVYQIGNVVIASKLKEDWIKEISDTLIQIIYDGQNSVNRINHITDKLNIFANEYSIYIINKTLSK